MKTRLLSWESSIYMLKCSLLSVSNSDPLLYKHNFVLLFFQLCTYAYVRYTRMLYPSKLKVCFILGNLCTKATWNTSICILFLFCSNFFHCLVYIGGNVHHTVTYLKRYILIVLCTKCFLQLLIKLTPPCTNMTLIEKIIFPTKPIIYLFTM